MCSSYQLKFGTSKNKKLNKKENNGDSKSFKLANKTSVLFAHVFSGEDLAS